MKHREDRSSSHWGCRGKARGASGGRQLETAQRQALILARRWDPGPGPSGQVSESEWPSASRAQTWERGLQRRELMCHVSATQTRAGQAQEFPRKN